MDVDIVRAVIFDVGNTLWFEARRPDIEEIVRLQARALEQWLSAWGVALPCRAEQVVRAVHVAGDEAERAERASNTFREVNGPFLLRGALAFRGVDISREQADDLWRATWILERHFGVQLYPDSLDVLAELKAHGLLIVADAVAS